MTPGTYADGPMKLVVRTSDKALLHYDGRRFGLDDKGARALLKENEPFMKVRWRWIVARGPLVMTMRGARSLVRVLRRACSQAPTPACLPQQAPRPARAGARR